MSDEIQYVSNPRLKLLAEELRILNDVLIPKKLPDRVRLFQLREFALAARDVTYQSLPTLEILAEHSEFDEPKWTASLRGKNIGEHATPAAALKAYKAAHIELFGIESQYHPDHRVDDTHLHAEDMPPGVRITDDVHPAYRAEISVNGRKQVLGVFGSVDEASSCYEQARIERPPIKHRKNGLPTGVRKSPSGFQARIKSDGVETFLGVYKTLKEAHQAYQRAHVARHGEASPYFAELQARKDTWTQCAAKARAARSEQAAARRQAADELYGNTPLPTGVQRRASGRFSARLRTGTTAGGDRVDVHLGVFDSPQEAHAAFIQARDARDQAQQPTLKEAA